MFASLIDVFRFYFSVFAEVTDVFFFVFCVAGRQVGRASLKLNAGSAGTCQCDWMKLDVSFCALRLLSGRPLPFYFPRRLLSARCSLNDLRVVALERGVGLESRDLAMSDAKL